VNDKFLTAMAVWLKKLHGISKPCKKHSMIKAIKPYFNNVTKHKNALFPEMIVKIDQLFERVNDFVKENDNLFSSRTTNSLIHRDLSCENILFDNRIVRLIDWEFSGYDFPEWDLVYFMQSLELKDKQKELFLRIYGYPDTGAGKKKLLLISFLNTCGDIGYSVWRLGLIKAGELDKKLKKGTFERLLVDMDLMDKIISKLEK